MRWRLVIEEAALELLLRERGAMVRALRRDLERLAGHPHVRPVAIVRGETGRPNFKVTTASFEITYWLDVYVNQIRIVEISRR